jgi:hypothetical protein
MLFVFHTEQVQIPNLDVMRSYAIKNQFPFIMDARSREMEEQ